MWQDMRAAEAPGLAGKRGKEKKVEEKKTPSTSTPNPKRSKNKEELRRALFSETEAGAPAPVAVAKPPADNGQGLEEGSQASQDFRRVDTQTTVSTFPLGGSAALNLVYRFYIITIYILEYIYIYMYIFILHVL